MRGSIVVAVVVLAGRGLAASCDPSEAKPLGESAIVFAGFEQVFDTEPLEASGEVAAEPFPWDSEIWLTDRQGDRVENLTDNDVQDLNPAVSPDGQLIAFTRWDQQSSTMIDPHELWIMDSSGRNSQRLTSLIDVIGSPRWTPDGRSLIFAGNPVGAASTILQGLSAIFRIDVATREWEVIADTAGRDIEPEVSPDGESVAFLSTDDMGTSAWVIPRGRGESVRLSSELDVSLDDGVHWSPDGAEIYFVVDDSISNRNEIWFTQILDGASSSLKGVDVRSPRISPTGEHLVFWTETDSSFELRLREMVGGTGKSRLLHSVPKDVAGTGDIEAAQVVIIGPPAWIADSRHVAVSYLVESHGKSFGDVLSSKTVLLTFDVFNDFRTVDVSSLHDDFSGLLTLAR